MATSFTAILQDRDDVTFREFCLRCAKAMGACIMQREDPLDKAMVVDEKPSDYHEKALGSARERLGLYTNMTLEQAAAEQDRQLAENRKHADGALVQQQAWQGRYLAMLKYVVAWNPPTTDHQGLKDFMAQQLSDSLDHDCDTSYWLRDCGEPVDCQAWLLAKRKQAVADCDYHVTEYRKELSRVTNRNKWKRELLASLQKED